MIPFKVVCVDATGMPDQLPSSRRVVEGQVYTVTEIAYLQLQSIQGYRLAEIDSFFPYEYFKASRFRPLAEQEAIKEEADLEKAI